MQLTFDTEVDDFLAEFVAFLDQNAPADAEALERPRSSSHIPDWARQWQRLLFDNGWLVPGNPPEFGGRNATVLQWTSGAHDADVILAFVRTDPDVPKHQGISVLLIPTDTPGLTRRPFASAADRDDLDFNEVFFTDVRVPVQNLVGALGEGWSVASGSLGHERNMLWLSFADRLRDLIADWRPSTVVERDGVATLVMDNYALRLLGSAALARAARGDEDVAGLSVLKLLGAETVQAATESALASRGADGLSHPDVTGRYVALNLDQYAGSWADRYIRSFAGTIAGGTSEIQRNIIAQRVLGLPRR